MFFFSIPIGEVPPPPPRACFGRDELIERVVGLAENLEPIALIGAGGIGKTSIALDVLHQNRIKERFGQHRRFIRCDQLQVSCANFLARLSKVIGAGVENPENLASLRPFLSSHEILIILDNAESILDPQGTDAQEIYAIVDELCQFRTICLLITSRITTVPRHCRRPVIPSLSMEAACDIFYNIYGGGGRSNVANDLLRRLDFHALSITLLATAASHNVWDYERLAEEWEMHRARVLRTDYSESLAATIELSLNSPTFHKLGPDARDLLGVIAFFPQGIDEKNLDWFFSTTVPDRRNIFDKFCVLSLAYRSNGYIVMLAPLRDYLCPKDPKSSPFLCITKECYFTRLAFEVYAGKPGYEEARWIATEDVNVEHLLHVFTSIDADSAIVWETCAYFMMHIYWHKERLVVLGPKIKGLPDDHPSKPKCLFWLGWLLDAVGNFVEEKQLLHHALKLWKEQGDKYWVAQTLRTLSDANRALGLYKEGIEEAKEALELYELLNHTSGKALSLKQLAWLWCGDKQIDKAEETAAQAIHLFLEAGEQFEVCKTYRILGEICETKGETEKAVKHFEAAIEAGSSGKWPGQMVRGHFCLAKLFFKQGRLGDAYTHLQHVKSHIVNDEYSLARAMHLQAQIQYQGSQLDGAMSEAFSAANLLEKLGATTELKACKELLQKIQDEINKPDDINASVP
jgi:tetratricopeptide (TPR) repeat protein